MIDVAREISKFKPIDLNFIPGRYAPTSDQMYESFVLYNKALHQIQLDKEDVAKSLLRKSISLFPDFYEANMVLGVLVFSSGDRIGAVRIFNSISDNSKREDAIKFLDHLVQEAEKPETARTSGKTSFADRHMVNSQKTNRNIPGRIAEREVIGDRGLREEKNQNKSGEARYSRGRVFETGGNFYEPQESREVPKIEQKRYGQMRRENTAQRVNPNRIGGSNVFVDDTVRSVRERETTFTEHKEVRTNDIRRSEQNENKDKSEGQFFREQLKDANDLKFLNKCLIVIIAILILFTIVLSTLLVNRTSKIKSLNDELNSITSKYQSDDTQ